ncbi:RNA polymerase factor sigma-54 [Staphylococcus durrellii]|uniref:RNA polymerase factor sigma-54 n=1 Tax=Staphylococcus durrellii TaxID=2781773 RepID=UPI00189F7708|nr:RNA polymerase factor sigma-54 [Staphylococcus durrellii]MBF7015945.1 RNA polymerase factor sigma-54 [Staphylococcus durrellii]
MLDIFQNQKTTISMTQQLSQSISLLQYSVMELKEFIQEEALENPLIEIEDKKYDNAKINTTKYKNDNDNDYIESLPNEDHLIWDELLREIKVADCIQRDKVILVKIILNLNESGFLNVDDDALARECNIKDYELDEYILLLQNFGPQGVGARSLKECLQLQVRNESAQIRKIVQHSVKEIANGDWEKIALQFKLSKTELSTFIEMAKKLKIKPFAYERVSSEYLQLFPDVIIEKHKKGFNVRLNESCIPNVEVNEYYLSLEDQNKELKSYIKQHYKNYLWLTHSLEKRQETLMNVTKSILMYQQDLFDKKRNMIKPMTLESIASDIDMNVSTISRTIKNKVIQSPAGTFYMADLFTSKLSTGMGDNVSSINVKSLINNYIKDENKSEPLSDNALSTTLREQNGIEISRRTVTKYRKAMRIASSTDRKKER